MSKKSRPSGSMAEKYEALMNSNRLGPDDSFNFACDRCGKCCFGHNDIILTTFDVVRMAATLGCSCKAVLERVATVGLGPTSRLPVVTMGMEDDGRCPLLGKDGRCTVQAGKPATCGLYPLGRACKMDKDGGGVEVLYFLQPVECGGKGETHTPREWLASFGLADSEREFIAWSKAAGRLSEAMCRAFDACFEAERPDVFGKLLGVAFQLLYVSYDVEAPVEPQFEVNTEAILQIAEAAEKTVRGGA